MARNWIPELTRQSHRRPAAGDVVASQHTVWKVTAVVDAELDAAGLRVWSKEGMPDLASWRQRPYEVQVEYLGGVRPDRPGIPQAGPVPPCVLTVRAGAFMTWHVYRDSGGRWPRCSCCGEPMPCRAQLQDEAITYALDRVELLSTRLPGCCWACGEPVTRRQETVDYPGDNLDYPGGPAARFHIRNSCWGTARGYERRWIAVDPRRERILTWPSCPGTLIVHSGGFSECSQTARGVGDCGGHLTADHCAESACSGYLRLPSAAWDTCPRGCVDNLGMDPLNPPRPRRRDRQQLPAGGQR